MAAVPPGRPEPEQEVAVSGGNHGDGQEVKGGIMGTDRKLKDPEQEEKGRLPAAATSKSLSCARRALCASCGMHAIGSPSLA